ncbi:MAG TPA: WG repeat-containing protein [Pyrinomonadaceae bacterium]
MRKKRRSFLFLICLSVFAAAAGAQPAGGRKKPAARSARLYQVYRYDRPYHRQFGFIDNTGKLLIDFDRLPSATDEVGKFHDGRALIRLRKSEDQKNVTYTMGYIDETGRIIIAPRFDYARDFSEGLAYVEKQGFHGYIDRQGRPVIRIDGLAADFQMEEGSPRGREFQEGLAAIGVGEWGGRWGYIDRSGRLVVKPEFRYADDFSEGLAGVVTNSDRRYGFIDKQGRMVVKPRFAPRRGGPHGFGIGGTSRFSEGLACVSEGEGLFGYINKKGDFVIPPQFARCMEFSEGLAWVAKREPENGNKEMFGWINASGQWVLSSREEKGAVAYSPGKFSEGLVRFSIYTGAASVFGYMDRSGKEIIKPQFEGALDFMGGVAQVYLDKKTYVEGVDPVDREGKTVRHWVDVYGYIDRQGRFIWRSK